MLLVALAAPAFAAENGFADLYYRMNDNAQVLTEDEDSELEASLEELSVRQSFDVIIATIDSLESEGCTSMEEYADDLYDYCQFGYGENRDGVLLLVSIGDRKWHISTCGYGITAFTDAGIQYLGPRQNSPIRCRLVTGASFTNQLVIQNATAAKTQRTVTPVNAPSHKGSRNFNPFIFNPAMTRDATAANNDQINHCSFLLPSFR